ncbi:MAG TPA: serine hydrolase domain-containing protein [Thermomicrobiales bacterium]|nr:serine hydrolase domain-containing protein [Thermomicrobiales bacterium]
MTEMLHQVVERYVDSGEFTGSVLVRRGEETLLAEARGFAHRGFAVPNTVDTRFDIASVTKIFTAVAVMQLVERGAIALDTPVMPYLGITGTKISDAVTVFHCLTHTSGIADDADEEAGEEYELLFVDKPNYSIRETRDFLPQFVDKEPNFPPGEGVRYNNVAYVLLGLVIEQASGIPYRDYVRQHVFERARMTGADFCAMDGIHAHLAEHYKKIEHDDGRVEWRKNIYSYPPIGSPDGGATVAVADLDRFLRALANAELLSRESSDLVMHPHAKYQDLDDGTEWISFGFEVVIDRDGNAVRVCKDGWNAGVSSMAAWYPQTGMTVVILANQNCNVWRILGDLESAIAVQ